MGKSGKSAKVASVVSPGVRSLLESRRMARRIVLVVVVALGFALVGMMGWKFLRPSFPLQACFHDITDLQVGAPVQVAGVETGEVTAIRRTQDSNCPVAVEFALHLPKGFTLPRSAPVRMQVAGVLGHPYLEIDSAGTAGPPARPHDTLPVR